MSSNPRHRRRPRRPPRTDQAATPAEHSPPADDVATREPPRSGYGRATLLLVLLLGTLLERAALSLPDDARNLFHLLVFIAIALLVALAYRAFARRTISQSRARRRSRNRRQPPN